MQTFNDNTNVFVAARTPLVIVFAILALNLLRYIFQKLGQHRLEVLTTVLIFALFGLFLFWFYSQYTGQCTSIAHIGDYFADNTVNMTKSISRKCKRYVLRRM